MQLSAFVHLVRDWRFDGNRYGELKGVGSGDGKAFLFGLREILGLERRNMDELERVLAALSEKQDNPSSHVLVELARNDLLPVIARLFFPALKLAEHMGMNLDDLERFLLAYPVSKLSERR